MTEQAAGVQATSPVRIYVIPFYATISLDIRYLSPSVRFAWQCVGQQLKLQESLV